MWTMKLWDSLATCLILLSAVCAGPLPRSRREPTSSKRRARVAESTLELPPVRIRLSVTSRGIGRVDAETADWEEKYIMGKTFPSDFQNVVDFIKVSTSRMRRSSSPTASSPTSSSSDPSSPSEGPSSSRTRHRRQRKKGGTQRPSAKGDGAGAGGGEAGRASRGGGRGQGCVLKQIHLNMSDLGLGYRSGEEMIFRYCSGPCRRSETNYDKILYNLAHARRLPAKDAPPQACCRPVAFDDDLSFLDDSLVYHTVRKHSARRCACV